MIPDLTERVGRLFKERSDFQGLRIWPGGRFEVISIQPPNVLGLHNPDDIVDMVTNSIPGTGCKVNIWGTNTAVVKISDCEGNSITGTVTYTNDKPCDYHPPG